jgi:hypothetical protein
VNDIVLVEGFDRLGSHDSIVESLVTSGPHIAQRAACPTGRMSRGGYDASRGRSLDRGEWVRWRAR